MRTVPRPCTRHRRPDARNEIAGTSPRRQPEGRTVFGLSLFTPTGACLSLGRHASGRQHPASTDEGKKQHPPLQSTRPRPPHATLLSVQGLHMRHSPAPQRAHHRPRTQDRAPRIKASLRHAPALHKSTSLLACTRSGAAHEELSCSTPLPRTKALRRPHTQKRGPGVKASGTVRKTLRPDTRSPAAPHASARLRFAQVQFRK